MRRQTRLLLPLVLLCFTVYSHGQFWSGILDPSRAIDWSANNAGVVGGIPANRTQCGATIPAGSSAATINTTIAACGANQFVLLGAGTFNLTAGLIFDGKSNVTLRGSGPDQTFLVFTGTNACDGHTADVCVMGYSGCEDCYNPPTPVNWTAHYAQGITTITLASAANIRTGMLLLLSQTNDSTDTGGIWVNDALGVASIEGVCGPSAGSHVGHCQTQLVTVTGVNGNDVTFTPGLYETNWRAGQSPRVWWTGTTPAQSPSTGVGIENLSIDNSSAGAISIISFHNTTNGWVENVRSINGNRNHVGMWIATHVTVQDSYFYGTLNAQSQSYGIEPEFAGDLLILNNIFQRVTSPCMMGNNAGSIYAYNFGINNYYSTQPAFMQTSYFGSHDAGTHMMLFEGNIGAQALWDTFHGAGGNQTTFFRNYLTGWEAGKTSGTVPVAIWANNRANNIIGNVLGKAGYHDTYQAGTCSTCIYSLGDPAWPGAPYQGVGHDNMVASSLMRWGNYDLVNGTSSTSTNDTTGIRWVSGEVPTTGIAFVNGNPVPASHTLPSSFFLSSKPAWWGSLPWPGIGPDVTSGNIQHVGGHANTNPAQACYSNVMGGPEDGSGEVLTFNASRCYPGGGGPPPPAQLMGVGH